MDRPRLAVNSPSRGIKNARVARIHFDIVEACVFGDIQNLIPILAAIFGFVDTAHRAGPENVTKDCSVQVIRINGINNHLWNLDEARVPNVGPRPATIGRPVDAIPGRDIAARATGARPDPDNIRI